MHLTTPPTDLDTKKIFVFLLATSCLLITLSNIRKGHKFLKHMEKVEIWSGVTDTGHTHSQRENRATQLVSSIKHKLSHAIANAVQVTI